YSEALSLDKAVTLFGALDCTTWAYDAAKRTQLAAAANAVPMALTGAASRSAIHDFAISAADATTAGGSSIPALAQRGVTLENVDLIAGKGAAGAAGAAQMMVMTSATADGKAGTADTNCNMASAIAGGNGGKNTCGGTNTNGGGGGSGFAATTGGA